MGKKLKGAAPSKVDLTARMGPNWNDFYVKHQASFFKDRHYQSSEFSCLGEAFESQQSASLVELGCGAGAALLPLMHEFPTLTVVGFDISSSAVRCLNAQLEEEVDDAVILVTDEADDRPAPKLRERAAIFQGSVVPPPEVLKEAMAKPGGFEEEPLAPYAGHVMRACQPHLLALQSKKPPCGDSRAALIGAGFFDFSLLMFVLSALPFELHEFVLREAALTLKPGKGRLLFRDYAVGDAAAARFEQKGNGEGKGTRRVDDNLYVRGDGTLAAFIDPRVLVAKAGAAGLVVEEMRVIRRSIENRGEGLSFERCWLHAVFRRTGYWIDRAVEHVALAGKIEVEEGRRAEEAAKESTGYNATMTQLILTAITRMMT